MQGLQKIAAPRQRLAELVYEQILAGLQSGQISPTERLHQVRLAELLDVSRTPVREALLRLEQEGILISTTNGGFEVREISEDDVQKIYQTRQAIEGFCLGQLARTANAETLDSLRNTVSKYENIDANTPLAYYEANRNIHRTFVEVVENRYLLESFDALWNRNLSLHIFQTMSPPQLAESLSGHMELCDAIQTGDFEHAQRAMHKHIADGRSLQLKAI
jgi:DNA-binding GntR family transcriptional regulator